MDIETSVVYMAGATDTHRKLQGVKNKFNEKFGKENVTIHNSILFGDRSESDRFDTIAENLKGKIEKGPTTIIAHSLGAAELLAALREIKKTDHNFFKNEKTKENLSIVFISPTILKRFGGFKYISKFAYLGVQEAGILGHTLPGKTSTLQGIVSVGLLPPKDETITYENLVKKVRIASPKLSRHNNTIYEISHKPDDKYYDESISEKTRRHIEKQDKILESASVETPKGKKEFKNALKKRGRLTRKIVGNIFDRTHSANSDKQYIAPEKPKKNIKASMQKAKFLYHTFVKGKTHSRLNDLLEDLGDEAKIKIAVPEYDLLMTLDKAERLMRRKKKNVETVALSTHTSPWVPQPGVLFELADFAHS